ncbi:MAG: S8 family serine peptidase [Prevotella sp.]|nr:S8 family serine peptidase [Prevotella sp.]
MKNKVLSTAILILCALAICNSNAQTVKPIHNIERKGNNLFLVENGVHYAVNRDIITVQKQTLTQILPDSIKQHHQRNSRFVDVAVPKGIEPDEYARQLRETGIFSTVELRGVGRFDLIPNDPYYPQLWHIGNLNLNDAWELTAGDSNIKIAVIDTGVDAGHYDLGNGTDGYSNIDTSLGWNYTNNSVYSTPVYNHGTAMAGIMCAKTNNGKGVCGVAGGNYSRGATIIPYCISNTSDIPVTSYISDAILDAIGKGANIINLSLSCSYSSDIDHALQEAYSHGVAVVCSSGNAYNNAINFPASHENTIAVGASNSYNIRTSESNYGANLDLVAPGENIGTTILNNKIGGATGTSAAAAIVSGTIALMLSVNPCLSVDQIRSILHNTCTKIAGYAYNDAGWNEEVSYGLLNVEAALNSSKPEIVGSTILCGEEEYYVSNISSEYNVIWAWEKSLPNALGISQNTPSTNFCTINNNDSSYAKNILVASIYKDSTLVAVARKNIDTGINFLGTYSQASYYDNGVSYPSTGPFSFSSGDTLKMRDKGSIYIVSDDFVNADISYINTSTAKASVIIMNNGISIGFPLSSFDPISVNQAITPGPIVPFDPILNGIKFTGKRPNSCETFQFVVKFVSTSNSNGANESEEYVEIELNGNKYKKKKK